MINLKKITWLFGVFLSSGMGTVLAFGAINNTNYDTSTDDYETRISDLEDAVETLQTQVALLEKQTSTKNSSTTTNASNATNSLYKSSPNNYTSNSGANNYNASSNPYGQVDYRALGSVVNKKPNFPSSLVKKAPTAEEQITQIQQNNITLQDDIVQRKTKLVNLNQAQNINPTGLDRQKMHAQNAITKDQNAIAANNQKIAELQAEQSLQAPALSQSPVLGSMNSTSGNKKKNKKNRPTHY